MRVRDFLEYMRVCRIYGWKPNANGAKAYGERVALAKRWGATARECGRTAQGGLCPTELLNMKGAPAQAQAERVVWGIGGGDEMVIDDDFVLVRKSADTPKNRSIAVSLETYETIREICEDSGLPAVKVLAQMVKYCNDKLVIK